MAAIVLISRRPAVLLPQHYFIPDLIDLMSRGEAVLCHALGPAQQRWRRLDGAALLPLVRAGVKFIDGVQKSAGKTNQPNEAAPREAA